MSGNTSVVSSTPGFVSGTFGAKDVRLATMTNETPGLFAAGDFAVTQRAAGANMSVDIADGRALINPAVSTHQGLYLARKSAGTAYNTSVDGGYTWTAADATNPRIDLLCLEIKDTAEDASGVIGYRFRIVDGTPSASATHQLEVAQWPAVPSGCLPIAVIRVPALATTLTTTNITNLNPIAGGRAASVYTATAETTTSATYARLATSDALLVYVPSTAARVRWMFKAHWKISAASGTQGVALFIDGNQIKMPINTGAPIVTGFELATLGTFYSHLVSEDPGAAGATASCFGTAVGITADVSDVTTGEIVGYGSSATTVLIGSPIDVYGLAVGWHLLEPRFKTNANTLSVRERRIWAEVVG